jgi:hypothetical protein
LVDGVVAVNEIIDLAKRSKKECLILKVDFEKKKKKHMIRSAGVFLGCFLIVGFSTPFLLVTVLWWFVAFKIFLCLFIYLFI